MASKIVHFIWTNRMASGHVDIQAAAFVAALTDDEWEEVTDASDWLTAKNRTVVTHITPTGALGGEHLTLIDTLKAIAEQYNYPSYGVDNPVFKKHGIERCASPPDNAG